MMKICYSLIAWYFYLYFVIVILVILIVIVIYLIFFFQVSYIWELGPYLGVIGSGGNGLCCGLGATSTKWIQVLKLFTGSWIFILCFFFYFSGQRLRKIGLGLTLVGNASTGICSHSQWSSVIQRWTTLQPVHSWCVPVSRCNLLQFTHLLSDHYMYKFYIYIYFENCYIWL